MIAVSETELDGLRTRERGYRMVDVTASVDGAPPGARVVTFAGPAGAAPPPGEVVLREYVRLVQEGARRLGDEFVAELWRTTDAIDVPIVDGPYQFVDPAQERAHHTWGKG